MLFDDNNNKSDYQKTIEEIDEYILFDQLTNNDKKIMTIIAIAVVSWERSYLIFLRS